MWADGRTSGIGDDDRNDTTWWTGRVLGPPWGSSLKNLFAMFFLFVQDLVLLVH